MKEAPFSLYRVTNTISDESAKRGDYETTEPSDPQAADFRDALDALDSDCWDNVDVRGDGTIIAYPADYNQDLHTGDYSADELIIHARRPEWGERLVDFWSAKKRT